MMADGLSIVTQDYLKAMWLAGEWGGSPATNTQLAARFDTSMANVTDVLTRLDRAGLVTREPYRPARLTAEGRRLAVAMVRRHRLIETFLVDVLGYDYTEVHDEAERLEHAVSDEFIDRLDAQLGHPATDPHGDPIPTREGEIHYPRVVSAVDAPTGRYRIARISDADAAILADLHAHRIHPGVEVVVDRTPTAASIRRPDADEALAEDALPSIWLAVTAQ